MFYICIVTHVYCVLFKCFVFNLCLCCPKSTSVLFCLNICMFCICVVTKLPCVLFKSLYVVHLYCLKVIVGSVYMFARFAFVLSQTYNVFCSIVCISWICVVPNVLCVLLKYLLVLQLCRHNGLVGPVIIKRLYILRLCRHKRMLRFF